MKNEINKTAHSTYRCEYHIVFAPKYRRQIVYGQIKKDIGEIIRKLCNEKKVEIIEAEACPNHIHMLVSIPPYLSIAQFVGFLKSKSTLLSVFRPYINNAAEKNSNLSYPIALHRQPFFSALARQRRSFHSSLVSSDRSKPLS